MRGLDWLGSLGCRWHAEFENDPWMGFESSVGRLVLRSKRDLFWFFFEVLLNSVRLRVDRSFVRSCGLCRL